MRKLATPFWEPSEGKQVIAWDVISYYEYLPAILLYEDPSFQFILSLPKKVRDKRYWLETSPTGHFIPKTTMGLAYAYLPGFGAGHVAALIDTAQPPDGYSMPYQIGVSFVSSLWFFLGLVALRAFLVRYFPDKQVAWALLLLVGGSMVFYYGVFEAAMPHGIVFGLMGLLFYACDSWSRRPSFGLAAAIGLLTAWVGLIRPVDVLLVLVPLSLLWRAQVPSWRTFVPHIAVVLVVGMVWVFPQLLYWKTFTGSWVYFSYGEERFFWRNPNILDGLFSYRMGLFVYSPVLLISLVGFVALRRLPRPIPFMLVLVLPLFSYVVFSWWCWWYGGGYGARAFVEAVPLLLLLALAGMGRLAQGIAPRWQKIGLGLFVSLAVYTQFMFYQRNHGILHHDAGTKYSFWAAFGANQPPKDYWDLICQPDYTGALKTGEEAPVSERCPHLVPQNEFSP